MKRTTKRLKTLQLDDTLLEIRPINAYVVSEYRQAMRNGDRFPPLVIDRKSRIICGYHRYNAAIAEFGEDHAIECEVQTFANEAAAIKYALQDNARHGTRLTGITKRRAICKLLELGEDAASIAQTLGVAVQRIEEMAGLTVVVLGGGRKQQDMPVKHGLEHMAGKTVSAEQYEAHSQADRGIRCAAQADQLRRWIENDWVDWEDAKTSEAMTRLHEAMTKAMALV